MAEPVIAFIDVRKDFEQRRSAPVILENGFFLAMPVCYLIHHAGVFDAKGGHEKRLSEKMWRVKQ